MNVFIEIFISALLVLLTVAPIIAWIDDVKHKKEDTDDDDE